MLVGSRADEIQVGTVLPGAFAHEAQRRHFA
jgi:hypothetical protein